MDVIETDLSAGDEKRDMPHSPGYSVITPLACLPDNRSQPYVVITEQPAPKSMRFRYECEGRSAGSLLGVSSSPENKKFPSIRVVGHQGAAVVVVSCVTKDAPYRPHPHNLVGKEGCKKGVCTLSVNQKSMSLVFSNLGIQCVKRKDVEDSLKLRESIRVDPFQTGFDHRNPHTAIDLNAVRLCFQVFIEGPERGRFVVPLKPIVSQPIYDKKSMNDLVIYKMSDCSSPASGGREIILLCDKVSKDDIEVRFFEVSSDDRLEWEGSAELSSGDVHKQVAISFRTPPYRNTQIDVPVNVFVQLRRPSDNQSSEPRPFVFTPLFADPYDEKRRKKSHSSNGQQRGVDQDSAAYNIGRLVLPGCSAGNRAQSRSPSSAVAADVKLEPDDQYGVPVARCNRLSPVDPAWTLANAHTQGHLLPHVSVPNLLAPNIVFRPPIVQHTADVQTVPNTTARASNTPVLPHCTTLCRQDPVPPSLEAEAASKESASEIGDGGGESTAVPIQLDMARLNWDDLKMLSNASAADFSPSLVDTYLSLSLSQSLTFPDTADVSCVSDGGQRAAALSSTDVRMDSAGQLDSGTLRTIDQLRQLNQLSSGK